MKDQKTLTTESGAPSSMSCSGSSVATASGASVHLPESHFRM